MTRFADATAVHRIGESRYAVEFDPGYTPAISGIVHGGYMLATTLRAVLDAAPFPDPVATGAHFLSPGAAGPAEIRLEALREGRTLAVTRASVVQDGRTLLSAHVTTADLAGETTVWEGGAPAMPPVEECVEMDPAHPLGPGARFLELLDVRLDPATAGWLDRAPNGVPEIRAYFRLREEYPPDALLVAFAVDAKPPAPVGAGVFGPASTVELTLHLRERPADGPLALRAAARRIGDGWFDEDVEVWDAAGRLVAQSRQLARRVKIRS